MSNIPDYRKQQELKGIIEANIPNQLISLWEALEKAWEHLDDTEEERDRLAAQVEELENTIEEMAQEHEAIQTFPCQGKGQMGFAAATG